MYGLKSLRENPIPHSVPSGGPFKPFFGLSRLRTSLQVVPVVQTFTAGYLLELTLPIGFALEPLDLAIFNV
jgi:hypothetical protein